jgi:sec-independent protein translocase protein TatA
MMPFKLGPFELVIILVVIFIIFGAGKLPQLFESMGKGIRSMRGKQEEDELTPKKSARKASKKKAV